MLNNFSIFAFNARIAKLFNVSLLKIVGVNFTSTYNHWYCSEEFQIFFFIIFFKVKEQLFFFIIFS